MLGSSFLVGSSAFAQVTITYNDGDNDATNYDTTAPNDPTTLTIAIGAAVQSGVISGTGEVIKTDSGSLTLSGENSYSGGTVISAGELLIGNGGTSGSILGNVDNSAFLIFNRSDDISFGGSITGTGGLGKIGTGRLTFSGSNSGDIGTFIDAGTLAVTGTINHPGGTFVVANGAASDGTLEISSGGSVTTDVGFVGFGDNSIGLATVTDGTWTNADTLTIGAFGNGTLEISNTGLVTSDSGILGLTVDSSGTARVSGSSWTNSSALIIGESGTGLLEVSGIGSVSNTLGVIGGDTTSIGTASISGGTWTNSQGLFIGEEGEGIVNLTGGILDALFVELAVETGSTGDLNIGTGTTVGTLNTLSISGGDGDASVNFNHTGTVDFSTRLAGTLGVNKLGSGTLVLLNSSNDYTGGTSIDGGTLGIGATGATGTGTITVLGSTIGYADGVVENNPIDLQNDVNLGVVFGDSARQNGAIGETGGSYDITKIGGGNLRLTGTNTYTGRTLVRNGQLTIRNGGSINTDGNIVVGTGASSDGALRVNGSGAGGSAVTSGLLIVGRAGNGEMLIDNGGTVSANGVIIGRQFFGTGLLVVTGAGSMLTSTLGAPGDGIIRIGDEGIGGLLIRNGGTVAAEQLDVGVDLDGEGGFLVRDSGSLLQVEGDLTIGVDGFGDGIVTRGAGAQVGGSLIIADGFDSLADLVVRDSGTSLFVEDDFIVGNEGDAEFRLLNQASAAVGTAIIGSATDSFGTVILNNSTWTIEDAPIIVGDQGEGGLLVRDGARLDQSSVAGPLILGAQASGIGEILIGGPAVTPQAPGVLDVESITTGDGSGTLTFNHNSALLFTRNGLFTGAPIPINGTTQVEHLNGDTGFYAASTYTGGTFIENGIVGTFNPSALGMGLVTLEDGTIYNPETLNIGGNFFWNGGTVEGLLGDNNSLINIDGALVLTTTGEFVFDPGANFSNQTEYKILSSIDPLLYDPNSDFAGNPLFGLNPVFSIVGTDLFINYPGSVPASGPLLQNTGPVNTPTFADFQVIGSVQTGTTAENNEIRSLTFNPGSNLQVFNQLLVGDGRFVVNSGTGTINGGSIVTPGDFTKSGGGTLVIGSLVNVGGNTEIDGGGLRVLGILNTNDLNFNGTTFEVIGTVNAEGVVNLNGGNTVVNGTLASNDFVNLNSGQLGGTGVIRGNFNNFGGTVAPGNSIGTLTVDGNYVQGSGATLASEIRYPGNADLLYITGTANIAGTLLVNAISNELSFGDVVTILIADGGIQGLFDRVTGAPSGFRARQWKVNGGKNLNLIFAPASYTQVAQGANQTALAAALDQWIGVSESRISAATLQLDLLRESAYPLVFESFLPTLYGSLAATTFSDSYSDGRTVAGEANFARNAIRPLETEEDEGDSNEEDSDETHDSDDSPQWRVWADARGGYDTYDPLNLDTEGGTILAGADFVASHSAVVGLYVGGQTRETDSGEPDFNASGPRFGVYGSAAVTDNFYLTAVIGGGTQDIDTGRDLAFGGSADASLDAYDWFTRLEGGYLIQVQKFALTPFIGLQYSRAEYDGFTEDSDSVFALKIDDWSAERVEGFIGLDIARPFEMEKGRILTPYGRLALRDTLSEDNSTLNSTLDSGNGPGFSFTATDTDSDGFEYGLGIRYGAPVDGWSVNLGYTGFSGNNGDSHLVNLGFSMGL